MSRLRKGKKFKGGPFAETFKKGISTNTPFSVVVAGERVQEAVDGAAAAATEAAKSNPADVIPSDTDYSREEIGAYFQRRKLAKEQEEFEAKQKKKDAKAAAKQLSGKDKRLAKKAARQGSRSDKKAIRQQKRSAKKANRKAKRKARRKGRK